MGFLVKILNYIISGKFSVLFHDIIFFRSSFQLCLFLLFVLCSFAFLNKFLFVLVCMQFVFGFQTDPSETLCCLATLCKRGVLFVTFFVLDWSQLLCCLSMVFVSAFSIVFFLVKIILNMYRPECVCYTRKAEFRVNRLRTGVSRFAANMVLMGRCGSGLRECGKVHTAHHILHDCTKFKSPCHIDEINSPALLEYFTQSFDQL